MKNTKLLFISKHIMCLLLFFPFVRPVYLEYYLEPFHIYTVFKLLSLIITIYIVISSKVRITRSVLLPVLLILSFFLSTVLNDGDLEIAKSLFMDYLVPILLILFYVQNDRSILINILFIHFEICVHLNLASILLFPNGLFSRVVSAYGSSTEWFLGSPNNFIIWLLPALLLSYLYLQENRISKRPFILAASSILTTIINCSGTGRVAIALFVLLFCLSRRATCNTVFIEMFSAATSFLSIVIFRSYGFIEPLVVNILGKDMTLSNRVFIWDNALNAIVKKPLLGHGTINPINMPKVLGNVKGYNGIWEGATHCHCYYLQLLFQVGFTGLLIFLLIITQAFHICYRNWTNRCSKVFSAAITSILFICITEVLISPAWLLIVPSLCSIYLADLRK